VGVVNLVLWGAGIVLVAVGYTRARGPWGRYQALKAEDAMAERYGAWRGGIRDDGKTGASVAMELLRGQARSAAAIAVVGIALIVVGFLVR
jgi:hypothetical protein